jgi:hypothetical protein
MRLRDRLPNYLKAEDVGNYKDTSKYLIFLDGTTYNAQNTETGVIEYSGIAAHTVIQNVINNIGKGRISLLCDITLTAGFKGAANIIFDGNYHKITPAASFNMVTMNRHFILQNCVFDVSAIAFTDACIVFDGADDYYAGGLDQIQRAIVNNCDGISAASRGTFILYDCTAAVRDIVWTLVAECTTKLFEYGYKMMATVGTSYINGNVIRNCIGIADKYFLYIEEGATNEITQNHFTMQCEREAETATCYTIDGHQNYFDIVTWDCIAPSVPIDFVASSKENYVVIPSLDWSLVVNSGTDNVVFCAQRQGPIGNASMNFFELTTGNPNVRVYGDLGGTPKFGYLQVSNAGHFLVAGGTTLETRIQAITILSLARDASGEIHCFDACGTDENQVFRVYGRNNADDARQTISAQWGDGTHEDGEIKTSSGDLRLTPAGVLRFGTRTAGGDTASNGYITTKDAAGNTVKLMTTA